MVTGADNIFIRKSSEVPEGESRVWVPLLSDKEMRLYNVPSSTAAAIFYPYEGDVKLTPDGLEAKYPRTWQYLNENGDALKSRKAVTQSRNPWWSPVRPRNPKEWRRPKLVCPHLVISPKFSLDAEGAFGISRSPFLYPRKREAEYDYLRFMLAVLNSSVTRWQLSLTSHKYSRGYLMMEPKTLKGIRVPDPTKVPSTTMRLILSQVNGRLADDSNNQLEAKLDHLVASLYGLDEAERIAVGMGASDAEH